LQVEKLGKTTKKKDVLFQQQNCLKIAAIGKVLLSKIKKWKAGS